MPEVPLRRVLSVSSEDPRFQPPTCCQPDEGGRWLSAKGGEKQISVVLELAEPKPIHSLHIGNCGSAFVEVLVGLAGGDYEVLVPTAAFLSPNESRAGAELKRVRLFGAQSLVKGVAGKSWERLRLVCSQPYCQTRPFGLSFVRVFSPPEDKEETPVRRLGPFTLREEGGSPPRPPGSLFYQRPSSPAGAGRGPTQASPGPSYAAAALQSSPKAPKRRLPPPKANGTPPGKQPAPGPGPSVSSPAPKVANSAPKASSSTQKSPSSTLKAPGSTPKALSSTPKAPSSSPRGSNSTPKAPGSAHKGSSSSPKGSSPAPKGSGPAPVLGGVVFALSGFENPLRSQLREAALGLGATYSPDWTEACTHLVSAFPRTPKVARARAQGGVVVGPSWIWECQKRQRRLPCGP
ncbi:DNA repair protein XRCC1-like [Dryobates pubescens]|uniref:DNA repair protein XRCC1-like n=1 Tax=Dryobates pubescens TaxID=118200 RepID=UPI0023B96EB7|nr:DNA repair protein XRCC1-like [Dryobates pubescens]